MRAFLSFPIKILLGLALGGFWGVTLFFLAMIGFVLLGSCLAH